MDIYRRARRIEQANNNNSSDDVQKWIHHMNNHLHSAHIAEGTVEEWNKSRALYFVKKLEHLLGLDRPQYDRREKRAPGKTQQAKTKSGYKSPEAKKAEKANKDREIRNSMKRTNGK